MWGPTSTYFLAILCLFQIKSLSLSSVRCKERVSILEGNRVQDKTMQKLMWCYLMRQIVMLRGSKAMKFRIPEPLRAGQEELDVEFRPHSGRALTEENG